MYTNVCWTWDKLTKVQSWLDILRILKSVGAIQVSYKEEIQIALNVYVCEIYVRIFLVLDTEYQTKVGL